MNPQKTATGPWSTSEVSLIGGRDEQQDAHAVFRSDLGTVCIVADGVGGQRGGREASQGTIAAIEKELAELKEAPVEARAFLDRLGEVAHAFVRELRSGDGMEKASSTLAVLFLTGDGLHFGTIGDTRVFALRTDGKLTHSRDDTVAQMAVERSGKTDVDLRTHPDRNKLTRSLASKEYLGLEYQSFQPDECAGFLVASDGLWEHCPDQEIIDLIRTSSATASEMLDHAARTAVKRAGEKADNTTAILVQGSAASSSAPAAEKKNEPTPTPVVHVPAPTTPAPPTDDGGLLKGFLIALNFGLIAYLVYKFLL